MYENMEINMYVPIQNDLTTHAQRLLVPLELCALKFSEVFLIFPSDKFLASCFSLETTFESTRIRSA